MFDSLITKNSTKGNMSGLVQFCRDILPLTMEGSVHKFDNVNSEASV